MERMEWICVLAAHLSDLLYLGSSLSNERATLAGRDDQPQGDWWLGADGAIGHQCCEVLEGDMGKKKKKCGENWHESPRGNNQADEINVEMEGEKCPWRVSFPTIRTEQAFNANAAHFTDFNHSVTWMNVLCIGNQIAKNRVKIKSPQLYRSL